MTPREFLMIVLVVSGCASVDAAAFNPADFEAAISPEIQRTRRAERNIGLSVGVVSATGSKWLKSFGERDRKSHAPMSNSTAYQVGDFSKVLTTLALLKLVGDKRVDLDAKVSDYLPEFAPRSRFERNPAIRVRDLLTHHSGLSAGRWQGLFYKQRSTTSGALDLGDLSLSQQTGQIYAYSNTGFEVLGALIYRVSGQPIAEFVELNVLRPLDLQQSGYSAPTDAARGHRKGERLPALAARDTAALGAWMSANDMLKLLGVLLDPKAFESKLGIPASLLRDMLTVQNRDVVLDIDNRTGLTWQLTNTGRHRVARVARMDIGFPGFRGAALLAPDEGVAAIVVANSGGSGEALGELARRVFDELLLAERGLKPPDYSAIVPDTVAWPASAKPAEMAPFYATALGLVSFAKASDGHFIMDFLGYDIHATERPDGWYQLRYRLLGLMPLSLGIFNKVLVAPARIDGEEVLLAYFQGGRFLFGQTLKPAKSMPEVQKLLGRYKLKNGDALTDQLKIESVELIERDGLLLANYTITAGLLDFDAAIPLLPSEPGSWVVPGLGTNMGDTLRVTPRGAGYTLEFSGYRFERD